MARSSADLAILASLGINSNTRRTTEFNRPANSIVYQDQLNEQLGKSNENANEVFKEERGLDKVYFDHHNDSNNYLVEPSDRISMSNKDFYDLSISSDLDYSKLMNRVALKFKERIINPTLDKEKITLQKLRQVIGTPPITDAESVKKYFSLKSSKPGAPEITYFNLNNIMNSFVEGAEKGILVDTVAVSNASKEVIDSLEGVVINGPQFVGPYMLFRNQLESSFTSNGIKYNANINQSQIKSSSTTALEAFETANLLTQAKLNLQSGYDVELESTGAAFNLEFYKILQKKIDYISSLRRPLSLDDVKEVYIEYIQNVQLKTGTSNKDFTSLSKLGVSQSGEVSKQFKEEFPDIAKILEDLTTGDIKLVYYDTKKDKNNEIVKTKTFELNIDAKFGADNQYTGKIKEYRGKAITPKDLLEGDGYNIKKEIQTILTFFILNAVLGEPYDIQNNIFTLLKYAFLGSNMFLEKFRKDFQTKGTDKQADLIAFRDGYIWFSEFFISVYYNYFTIGEGRAMSSSRKKGSLSSEISSSLNILKNHKYLSSQYRKFTDKLELIKELKKISTYDQDIVDIFDKFLNTGLELELNISALKILERMKK